jgi:hypothetical protein
LTIVHALLEFDISVPFRPCAVFAGDAAYGPQKEVIPKIGKCNRKDGKLVSFTKNWPTDIEGMSKLIDDLLLLGVTSLEKFYPAGHAKIQYVLLCWCGGIC